MFDHLIGNNQVKLQLEKLVEAERVPNSLLFSGPDAVGKKLFALQLARHFVCRSTNNHLACNECSACVRVTNISIPVLDKGDEYDRVFFSGHSDVGMIVPFNQNLRVGSVRALEMEAHFRPFEGRARIFLIEDAEKMTDAAANALLKTLEEPPDTTIIVLITSQPDRLLPTIRSRSQLIRFSNISFNDIEAYLVRERLFQEADAKLAARISGGSLSRAISFNTASYKERRESLLELLGNSVRRSGTADSMLIGERLTEAKNKGHFEADLGILELLIHDVWSLCLGSRIEDIQNIDIGTNLSDLSMGVDCSRLSLWLTDIEKMRNSFRVNANRKLLIDSLVLKMAG